jgi:Tfp pilus assembly protein PilF
MSASRIEILQQLLAQNPASSFARYGLAMEYLNSGELSRAVTEFGSLIEADPAYAAAYYHGGQTLEKLGRLDAARDYYRRGILAASDPHARSELQAALDILGE